MAIKNYKYTTEKKDLFENIIHDERIMLNHVIIESGKLFPKHPTDAHVYITVISGELSITLGDKSVNKYYKGDVVEVEKGVESILGNTSDDFTEVFVVKIGKEQ